MSGAPGAGKSMLAQRLPSILPPLTPRELLEVSMIHSVAGALAGGALTDRRPFRSPHHSASMPALVGGGAHAKPGEISLAHNGVLFLDELPEFQPQVLDSLRQPIETGEVAIARANHRVVYPARFQLIAAMNPCRCGMANEPGYACKRAPNDRCVAQYLGRLSGPLLDRFDLVVDVPSVSAADLMTPPAREGSAEAAARVAAARKIQLARYAELGTRRRRLQRPRAGQRHRGDRGRGRSGADAVARRRRAAASFGARLSSRAQACPHPRRPRRRRPDPSRASRRSAVLPRRARPRRRGGMNGRIWQIRTIRPNSAREPQRPPETMGRVAEWREAGLSGIANGFWRRFGGYRGSRVVPAGRRRSSLWRSRSPPPSPAPRRRAEARAARIAAENDGLRDELWRLKEAAGARDRAEAASEAKSRFLTTMSHEIRTPISGILGMADLLREASLDPENASYVEAIRSSGSALIALIDEILDLGQDRGGPLRSRCRDGRSAPAHRGRGRTARAARPEQGHRDRRLVQRRRAALRPRRRPAPASSPHQPRWQRGQIHR